MSDLLRIFSDPHLGVNRIANTTIESRKHMQHCASKVFSELTENPGGNAILICGGDLFDGAKVPNEVLLHTFDCISAENGVLVVGGNHDMSNNNKDITAFDLLAKFLPKDLVNNEVGQEKFEQYDVDCGSLIVVPHHSSQDKFDAALHKIISGNIHHDALFLHCTYDFSMETSETALNLTPEVAEKLLTRFKRIFIGHEHVPSEHFDGRLIMLGSTMPFTMGEIADRYCYTYDVENDVVEKEVIWSKAEGYRELNFSEPADMNNLLGPRVEFVDLVGNIPSEDGPELSAWISALWQANPNLCMVRNKVQVGTMEGSQIAKAEAVLTDLSNTIEQELKDSDLKPLWDKYKEAS